MKKGYKYRIYPTKEQELQIIKTFGACRFIYNKILSFQEEIYETENKFLSKMDCNNYCNRILKNEYKWLKEIDKFAITNSIYDLDNAYKNFFRDKKQGCNKVGFPKYKTKKNNNFSYKTNQNIKELFSENLTQIPKLGKIKTIFHRKFKGKILNATISKTSSGKYFVSFCVECEHEVLPKANKAVGVDLGIKDLLITSDGEKFKNLKPTKKYEDSLAKLQRQQSKMIRYSNNFKKQNIKIARIHEKIKNIRKNNLHLISSLLIKENQLIFSEDLNIKDMVQNKKLAKSIYDASWYELTRQLTYKAEWNNRIYIKINKWFASSQLCSICGYQNKETKDLSIREWFCPNCGIKHDRDLNASINILNEGLKIIRLNI